MSIAQTMSQPAARPRWLLLGSLALNLFFIGVAVALAIRAPSAPPTYDRDVFVRIDRLAASLPAADAAILRAEIESNRAAVQEAQRGHRAAQNVIRDALRHDPFDPQAVRTAMAQTRVARQTFDQVIQGVVASAATKMSQAGRNALADWPPGRRRDEGK
jgi:uncharacterized membrane protein